MNDNYRCKCEAPLRWSEDDRGSEVYCDSCGAANLIPAAEPKAAIASAPPAKPAPATGVFSSAGREKAMRGSVRETRCLCGRTISYTLEDIGSELYCTCGNTVRVGDDLDRRQVSSAQVVDDALPPPKVRFQFVRSRLGFSATLVLLSLVGGGAYYATTLASLPTVTDYRVDVLAKRASGGGGPAVFDPTQLDEAAIRNLAAQDDFFAALKQAIAWRQGLTDAKIAALDPRFGALTQVVARILEKRRSDTIAAVTMLGGGEHPTQAFEELDQWARVLRACDLADDDERILLLRTVGDRLTERIDPITLAMIDELRRRSETLDALQQGELWKEALDDRRAAADDPRRPRLDDVLVELRERLVPGAKPRPWIEQFRGLTKVLSEKLAGSDLDAARKARDACEALLQAYPDDLGPLAPRFMSLKAHLRALELEIEGLRRIELLFTEAERAVADVDLDGLGAGIEARDRARHLVRITPLSEGDAKSVDDRFKALKPKMQLALGRRAVRDALRSEAAKDTVARDLQVQAAAKFLPGLPEELVHDEMSKIRPWLDGTTGAPRKPVQRSVASTPLGRRLQLRDLFEAALGHFGEGDTAALASACQEYERQVKSASGDEPNQLAQLKTAMFDALETQVTQGFHKRTADANDPRERLVQARAALDIGAFWRDDPRWKVLDGALTQMGDSLGREAVARAVKAAEAEDLDTALTEIAPAMSLGDAATREQAQALHDAWHKELQRRADAEAETTQWNVARHLADDPAQALAAAYELKKFLERYPNSRHADEARRRQQSLLSAIEAAFADKVRESLKLAGENRWPDALEVARQLEAAASGDAQAAVLAPLRKIIADKKVDLQREFRELGNRQLMISVADTQHVLRVAGTLALIEPTRPDVVAMFAKAEKRGAVLAAALVRGSKGLKNLNPKKFRDDLQNAYWLDPYGEAGREARTLLGERSTKT